MSEFDIFLSYDTEIEDDVHSLFNILTKDYFLKVWLDKNEPFSTTYYDKIVNGVGNSTIFLGLVTRKYCRSDGIISELKFAHNMNKSMIFILIESIPKVDLDNIGFVFDWTIRFDAFNDLQNFKNGYGKIFDSVIKSIKREIVLTDKLSKNEAYFLNTLNRRETKSRKSTKDGKRVYKLKDGTKVIGEWSDNNLNGKGRIEYPSGEIYEGNFIEQKRNGFGNYKFKNGDQYIGEWLNDKPNGKGKYKWANGDVYHGDFEESFQTGKGIFEFKGGEKYVGEFLNSEKHGKGKFYYLNGNIYDGMWANDNMHGTGILYFKNGDRYEGEFGDNKYISGKYISSNSKDQLINQNNFNAAFYIPNLAHYTPNNFSNPYYPIHDLNCDYNQVYPNYDNSFSNNHIHTNYDNNFSNNHIPSQQDKLDPFNQQLPNYESIHKNIPNTNNKNEADNCVIS